MKLKNALRSFSYSVKEGALATKSLENCAVDRITKRGCAREASQEWNTDVNSTLLECLKPHFNELDTD
ncbi:hypothetical protein AB4Y32_37130 [Paraburkholderia phymatum]|uniref:Uncharacterized protein n=1 Tax=Paraburkholderia phymatum TaxID=148447 RepID=A0ACC6UCK4_9BURK